MVSEAHGASATRTKSLQSRFRRSCESARHLAAAFLLPGRARGAPAQSGTTERDCETVTLQRRGGRPLRPGHFPQSIIAGSDLAQDIYLGDVQRCVLTIETDKEGKKESAIEAALASYTVTRRHSDRLKI